MSEHESEVLLGETKRLMRTLGLFGRQIGGALPWLQDKKTVLQIIEEAKKEFWDLHWKKGADIFDPDLQDWAEKWFGSVEQK